MATPIKKDVLKFQAFGGMKGNQGHSVPPLFLRRSNPLVDGEDTLSDS
jgi:hypothetical protein